MQGVLRLGLELAHRDSYHILLAKQVTRPTQNQGEQKQTPHIDGRI